MNKKMALILTTAIGLFAFLTSFIGEGTFDEENATVTIEDEVSEMSLTFGVTANDDDTLTLDMGDLGSATVQEATLAVAVQGLKYAVENGTEMN